jgi:hypothetical protein
MAADYATFTMRTLTAPIPQNSLTCTQLMKLPVLLCLPALCLLLLRSRAQGGLIPPETSFYLAALGTH